MATTTITGNTGSRTAAEVYASLNVNGSSAASTTNKSSEQQARFLKLLTAQLKNQDPLAPMDNAQMTSQLAQISTVDGIERMNSTLQSLVNGNQTTQSVQAAALLGKGVLVPGSTTQLASGQALGGFELARAADKVTVEIRNANGLLVRTLNLGVQEAGVRGFMWDGLTDAGATAVDGKYSFTVKASQGSADVSATRLAYGVVNGVGSGSAGTRLNVGSLGDFATTEIRRIM